MRALRDRLTARKDEASSVAKRMANARRELARAKDYDYLVVNDDLGKAVDEVESIIISERLRTGRRDGRDLIPR